MYISFRIYLGNEQLERCPEKEEATGNQEESAYPLSGVISGLLLDIARIVYMTYAVTFHLPHLSLSLSHSTQLPFVTRRRIEVSIAGPEGRTSSSSVTSSDRLSIAYNFFQAIARYTVYPVPRTTYAVVCRARGLAWAMIGVIYS